MTVLSMSISELQQRIPAGCKVEFVRRGNGRGRPAKVFGTFKKFNQNGTVRVCTPALGTLTLNVTDVSFILP